jgi:hypothetical protein
MSTDDEFLTHLRDLACESPGVAVDRARVLHLGRRRRAARATGVAAVAVLAVAGVSGGVTALAAQRGGGAAPAGPVSVAPAPTPDGSPDPSPTAAVPVAVVDDVAGTIALPLDAWMWSDADFATSQTAVELAASQCMAAAGMADELPFQPYPVPPSHVGYGVWQRDVVAATGYAGLVPADPPGGGLDGDDPRIATQRDCYVAAHARYAVDVQSIQDGGPQGYQAPGYLPEGVALLDEWRQCLADHGVTASTDGAQAIPDGITTAPLAEQIRVGLIDVDCKESMDFVQRFAEVEAASQLDYIARAEPFLTELHAAQQQALAASRALLEANGVPIPGE